MYIERDLLKMAIEAELFMTDSTKTVFRSIVRKVPAADVAPVVHGEWEIKTDEYDCEMMVCSVCGEEFYDGDNDTVDHLHNYCPNCGAKMDGEQRECSI